MKVVRWRQGIVALAAAALASCALGPDYERPAEVTPPEAYRNVLSPQDARSLADLAWVDLFPDPELQALVREALDRNLNLLSAVARVEQYRAQLRVARSYLGPQLRGSGTTSPSPQSDQDSSYALGLALTWEIDLFGRIRRSTEAANALYVATRDDARGVMSALVAQVMLTWFQLRELDQEVEIITSTIKSQEESLELVRSLKRSGVASAAEEQQAISQLATTRAQLPAAELSRNQTESLLSTLLDRPPGSIPRSTATMAYVVPPDIPVGLPAQLLSRRPDLRASENTLRAANADIGVALASRFPYLNLGLTSFFGVVSPEIERLLDGDAPAASVFSIGPTIDIPIFQSGRGAGNVEAARAIAKQSEYAYRQAVLDALREVSDTLLATDRIRDIVEQNLVRADAAAEVLRLQRMRYRAGVVSYLEVLDAERQKFSAEIDLSRSRLDRLEACVQLYRALGGGWSEEELARLLSP